MGDGGHPPGEKFQVKCTGKTGTTVVFSGEQGMFFAAFAKQEDADYFAVGNNYAVDFSSADSGEPSGSNQPAS